MPRKRRSSRKGTMPRSTPSGGEDMASLIALMASIPDRPTAPAMSAAPADDAAERPQKRAKTGHHMNADNAICVMQDTLTLPPHKTSNRLASSLSRHSIGHAVTLSWKQRLDSNHRPSVWDLRLAPNGKHSVNFTVMYEVKNEDVCERLATALEIASASGSPVDDTCSLWASYDVDLEPGETDMTVLLRLTVHVKWNEANNAYANTQSSIQYRLRRRAFTTLWPKLTQAWPASSVLQHVKSGAPSWSPQDFYAAAFVPDSRTDDADVANLSIPGLMSHLYPFQRRAVQWLLQKEGVRWCRGEGKAEYITPTAENDTGLPISFHEMEDVAGGKFYASPLFGLVTRDSFLFRNMQNLRGGILAEEMGLGKTLEIIALILLHQRLTDSQVPLGDRQYNLRASRATLIVAPSTLLDQWLAEFRRHAPELRITYFSGLRKMVKDKSEEAAIVDQLAGMDVVVTTYEVLRSEIHMAVDPPDRCMRQKKQYERLRSPLVQISWWRVCIDEAQMVENFTSSAAQLARLIPRRNAWAITGTPVKNDPRADLRGLLIFLGLEPYASSKPVWDTLTTQDKESFTALFHHISMRHTKRLVRDEIAIPRQRRFVITMPFTAVEEQHYQSLFKELTTACGLDTQGAPLREDWDPEDGAVQEAMRRALDRLRQSVLNPEIGLQNRRALGTKSGPMRTQLEVLNAMIEQSDGVLRTERRNLLLVKLARGQILAHQSRVNDALDLWKQVLQACDEMVAEYRRQLAQAAEEATSSRTEAQQLVGDDGEGNGDSGEARRRLRYALELQHKTVFFVANAYFSIKSNEGFTVPDSEDFRRLEQLETDAYQRAKDIRKELLQESRSKAKGLMDQITDLAAKQNYAVIPEFKLDGQRGLESRRILDAQEEICLVLNDQAGQLDDWREHVIQLLSKPLVDEDDDEITGEEYDDSTKLQDEILVYAQLLRTVIADRQLALSGQVNTLVEHEIKNAERLAKIGEGPFPERFLELLEIRNQIKPPFTPGFPLYSSRGVISELRALALKLRNDASRGNARAAAELCIVESHMSSIQSELAEQNKVIVQLEREIERFTDAVNARLDYYRQLQDVSDMVADYDGPTDERALARVLGQEEILRAKLATAQAKHRYLLHLKEADSPDEQRTCVICQTAFSIGVLTICGHQFCKECIGLWLKAHHNCPVCKHILHQRDLHDINLKPQELRVHSDTHVTGAGADKAGISSFSRKKSTIYAELDPQKLAAIKSIELNGPNFTTKVDTLVRHLLFLRESDPGAKSVVFSQYKEFLDVLATAFHRYRIGFTSFDKANGIASFKGDPGKEVFLLHARAHASGLNLVNANHVFLCEPLLNTALELQAIARVDRIGQQHETTVWLYIVDGTVEQSIYNLSVQRRMEHIGPACKGKSKESTPELLDSSLEAANSLEMQQAHLSRLMGTKGISGEAVEKKDLWSCLFGHVQQQEAREEQVRDNPAAVRGFLAAEAAEGRMRQDVE